MNFRGILNLDIEKGSESDLFFQKRVRIRPNQLDPDPKPSIRVLRPNEEIINPDNLQECAQFNPGKK